MMMKWLLAGCLLAVVGTATAEVQYRVAEARDAKTGELLYRELHRLHWQNQKLRRSKVIYVDPTGSVLAAMTSDFSESIACPETRFVTAQGTYSYDVERTKSSRLTVRYRDSEGPERQTLKIPDNAVCSQGFSYVITEDIGQWRPGRSDTTAFLIPGRFDYFRFKIEAGTRSGDRQRISMRLANVFLRMFVSEIAVDHEVDSGLLMRYEGPSNVAYDADDDPVGVIITYETSSGERFSESETAAAALLAKPIF